MHFIHFQTLDQFLDAKFPTKYVKTKAEQYLRAKQDKIDVTVSTVELNKMK